NVIRVAQGTGCKQFQLRDVLADGGDVGHLAGSHRGADFGAIGDQNRSLIGNDLDGLLCAANLHFDVDLGFAIHVHDNVVLLSGLESASGNTDVVSTVC